MSCPQKQVCLSFKHIQSINHGQLNLEFVGGFFILKFQFKNLSLALYMSVTSTLDESTYPSTIKDTCQFYLVKVITTLLSVIIRLHH